MFRMGFWGRARWHRAGSGHGDSRDQGVFGGRGCCGGSVPPCVPSPRALPDAALGVPEHGGGEALRHPHQAGAIHLHDQVVHLDPGDKGTVTALPPPAHLPSVSPQSPRGCSSRSLGEGFGAGHPLPAVPVGCPPFCHRLDEDAQLLQAHVGPRSHANDADPQPLGVCGDREPCPGGGSGGCERPTPMGSPRIRPRGSGEQDEASTHLSPAPRGRGRGAPPSSPARTRPTRPWGRRPHCGGRSPRWSKC